MFSTVLVPILFSRLDFQNSFGQSVSKSFTFQKFPTIPAAHYNRLLFVETPKIKAMKSNVTVVTGGIAEQNTAILQCNRPVEGCPSGHIIWKYEQHTLSNNSRFMVITTSNTTKLIINNVNVNDSGKYECEVIDLSNGGQYSERVHLNVTSECSMCSTHNCYSAIILYRCHPTNNKCFTVQQSTITM